MFEDFKKWPELEALRIDLCNNWELIRDEALSVYNEKKGFKPWQEPHIYEGKWDVYGIYWGGKETIRKSEAPITKEIISAWQPLVFNAGFSLLNPGVKIKPHVGYTSDVIRMHVGLLVPSDDSNVLGIRVGKEVSGWKNGEAILFDDTQEHEAWNNSNSIRIVLLLDLLRPAGREKMRGLK